MKQFYRLNLTEQPHALSELYYAQPWLDLQARTGAINHLFVYGTLMTGQIAQRKLSSREGCRLKCQAFLAG